MKKVAILQSNYIPWKGYFDLIASVDEFILFEDAQYTRQDWRNRNQIKTPQGVQWLTIPIKGRFTQTIRETEIAGDDWQRVHWKCFAQNYRRAPFYSEISEILEPIYGPTSAYTHLSPLNRDLIQVVCHYLGITTKISSSGDYRLIEGKTERLVDFCVQANGTSYVSGPSAKNYLDERLFASRGLSVEWFDYEGYPPYNQLWGEFTHHVSILDLLFNCGKSAPRYMRYVRP